MPPVGVIFASALAHLSGSSGVVTHVDAIYRAVSKVTGNVLPRAACAPLQAARFGPNQGRAALRVLHRRAASERGKDVVEIEDDDACAERASTVAVLDRGHITAALQFHPGNALASHSPLARLLCLERFVQAWPAGAVVVGTRLTVLADYRSHPVMDLLLREAYQMVRDAGTRFCLITCTPELHMLFALYGFQEYLPPVVLDSGKALLRMALVCEHATGLQACSSPLLDLVQRPDQGDAAHAWLASAFPMLP